MIENPEKISEPTEFNFGPVTIEDINKFNKGSISTLYKLKNPVDGDESRRWIEVLDSDRVDNPDTLKYFTGSSKDGEEVIEHEGRFGITRLAETLLPEKPEED